MDPITIENQTEQDGGWLVEVTVGQGTGATRHNVTVDRAHYESLTGGAKDVAHLVTKSFEFLLARESKHSILSTFNLKVISRYFPEYEKTIKNML